MLSIIVFLQDICFTRYYNVLFHNTIFVCIDLPPDSKGISCSLRSSQLHLQAEDNFSNIKSYIYMQQLTKNGPLVVLEPLM